jgi:hypothetical protein
VKVLDWLQELAVEQGEREAKARANITDPVMMFLDDWARGGSVGSQPPYEQASRLAHAETEHGKRDER